MKLPVVGLTTYRETAAWGVWNQPADVLPTQYARIVEAAGGLPVLLPAVGSADAARQVVARLDGLIISGGADVDPSQYGAPPHPRTAAWRPDRDAWEIALLDAAEELGLPVLGVCRGMQLMAVRSGGTLDQHTPDLVGHDEHNPGADAFGTIAATTVAGSRLASLVGDAAQVACHHHQSVRTHPGFVAAAFAADGTLEAMEAEGDRFCVAVQWHPETAADTGLLAGLVAAATVRPGADGVRPPRIS